MSEMGARSGGIGLFLNGWCKREGKRDEILVLDLVLKRMTTVLFTCLSKYVLACG